MRVFILETCGTEFGAPNHAPNGQWEVLQVWATRPEAEEQRQKLCLDEFRCFRVRGVEVRGGR